MTTLHRDIKQLCSELGKDPLLVQGAGGNISWKEGDVLWIKGSGTWLVNATQDDIFVPVDLPKLSHALVQKDFYAQPQLIGEHALRPSIETTLHALMPQAIVAHLHAIYALTYLVNKDSQKMVARLFEGSADNRLQVAFVQYHKPGPQLAQAIQEALIDKPNANIIFLKNHGIVVGADSIGQMKILLNSLELICNSNKSPIPILAYQPPPTPKELEGYYAPFSDTQVHALALDPDLYSRLASDWVLYPDHAVFLGADALTFSSWGEFIAQKSTLSELPELIFIGRIGVFVRPDFNLAKTAQLRCYYDVISRLAPNATLDPLSHTEIDALLNWDAEKLRQQMAM
jgi:rhamnose utilization protein RhaD (predicted bifunctional aldolase and dehydrogenase)